MRRSTAGEIVKELQQLQAYGIIEYLPQKEKPQIYFLLNRAPAQFLHIDHKNYLHRKQQYELRVETMQKYITLTRACRSVYIAGYFGDSYAKDCGVCDNCLYNKTIILSETEFKKIETRINNHIPESGIPIKELLLHTKGINKEKFWKVMNYLEAERLITVDALGIAKRK